MIYIYQHPKFERDQRCMENGPGRLIGINWTWNQGKCYTKTTETMLKQERKRNIGGNLFQQVQLQALFAHFV